MKKRVTNSVLLQSIDAVVEDAVEKTIKILNNPQAKNTEVLNAADKLIKLRFQIMENSRKEASDKIDMQYKILNLEEKRIKVEALRLAADPNSTPSQRAQASRVFDPPKSHTIPDAEMGNRVS